MPKKPTKGTKQVLLELPEQFVAEVKAFADSRDETFKAVVIHALRRHMAYPPEKTPPPAPPPPVPPPPLPTPEPFPDSTKKPPVKKGKK
jgi:hypothetical protein